MFKVGDFIIYNKDVCKIIDIKEKYFKDIDYYILESYSDNCLKLSIPTTNNKIRSVITKTELDNIISDIPNIPIIEDERTIENIYKSLMKDGEHRNLIQIIKTTYQRNKNRIENNKKISEIDDNYFKKAEQYLYNEFSVVLNMNYEDTKNYVINKLDK